MDVNNLYETWQRVCDTVRNYDGISAPQVDAFFGRLHPQAISEGFLIVTAETDFIKTQVERRFLTTIQQALKDLTDIEYFVEIDVDPTCTQPMPASPAGSAPAVQATPVAPARQPAMHTAPAQPFVTPVHSAPVIDDFSKYPEPAVPPEYYPEVQHAQSEAVIPAQAAPAQPEAAIPVQTAHAQVEYIEHAQTFPEQAEPRTAHANRQRNTASANSDDNLASALTFETFVIGDSNRLAYSMAVSVAEAPGKPNLNPLFIYGRSGLGKTHLLRAIQNYILETDPAMHVVYIDSSEFLSDYTSAVAEHDKNKNSYQNFQNRYLEADVLLIDDVQYFQGKTATVDIVFQLFNKLTTMGKQVVLAADRAPKMIDIDERYKSRFNSGGTFAIQPPEIETKMGIVKSFIEEYKQTENRDDIYVPEDIQMYIAEISSSNVRELKSAVTKVIFQITYFNNANITLADVKSLLEDHFSAGIMKRLSVTSIQKEVEQYYRISHNDLVGTKRSRNVGYARQVAIYLCRQMLDITYNDIGKKFNRDHSTVMYSIERIEDRLKESRELQEEIEIITKNIREN